MRNVVFFDLLKDDIPAERKICDFCVIGAGAIGTYVAVELSKLGYDTIILEAGDEESRSPSEIGFEVTFSKMFYSGATTGRFFGLGGSTTHWGGVLVPHTEYDLRDSDHLTANVWEHIISIVSNKYGIVLKKLGGNRCDGYFDFAQKSLGKNFDYIVSAGLMPAASLYLPISLKNFSSLISKNKNNVKGLKIFQNAVVNSWRFRENSLSNEVYIISVKAISRSGRYIEVEAKGFILAAGAIESTRILLEMNMSSSVKLIKSEGLGCYLGDHLSVPIAEVAPEWRSTAIKLFSPYFQRGWMRAFRFIEISPPQNTPRAFAHFIFENQDPGFYLIKELLGAVQRKSTPKVSKKEFAAGIKGLLFLGYGRYMQKRLYISQGSHSHLQLDIEQEPSSLNRITLQMEKDRFGRWIPNINWEITETDFENIKKTSKRILKKWPGPTAGLPELIPLELDFNLTKPYDAYHPVGTCRLGQDKDAVVDFSLKVNGIDNLWVLSTAVLPSAGTANPTFTVLCMAEALVDHLHKNRIAN